MIDIIEHTFGVIDMAKNKYVLKNKRKFFSFVFVISVLAFIMIYTSSVSGYQEPKYQSIFVNSGDTLWSIAEKYGSDSIDIRDYIYNIREINNLDSSNLYENTTILIPVEN